MRNIVALLLAVFATGTIAASDPPPVEFLAGCEGKWSGSLRYRDYGKPDTFVTLPTTLSATLVSPDEIAFHYVYDEGRGRVVHGYERIKIDRAAKQMRWSGADPAKSYTGEIVSITETNGGAEIVATRETTDDGKKKFIRYRFSFSAEVLVMAKEDGADAGSLSFRNEYRFSR